MFEGLFYKGDSNSRKMNGLVLRLRLVEMVTGLIIHVISVAGTRMKILVIDGLSRGDLLVGMMTGQNPLDFIPLNESDDERSEGRLLSWINSWWKDRTGEEWGGRALKRLSHDDWFHLHTQYRPILWTPPPADMETVVELFNEDCLSHPHILHVFAIPCLMAHSWRRQLSKDADVLFTINMGHPFGPDLCMNLSSC